MLAFSRLPLDQQHTRRSLDHGKSAGLVVLQARVGVGHDLGAKAAKARLVRLHRHAEAVGALLQPHLLGVNQLSVAKDAQGSIYRAHAPAVDNNGQIVALSLAHVDRRVQRLDQHLRLAFRAAQRHIAQLDLVSGGEIGLGEGLAHVLAPIREQDQALGSLAGQQGHG